MPVKFLVARSDVTIEAGYSRPEFSLFRDDAGLFSRLIDRLSPHGLKLSDMKIERGSGTLGELHLFFYLLDFLATVRIRLDRVEIYCSHVTEENKKRFVAAVVDTLDCIRQNVGGQYRAYGIAMNIHGLLENQSARAFVSKLVSPPPAGAGSVTGSAVAYYFAPAEDRVASSLTFDVSAVTPDGLYVRPQATWDASRLPLEQFAERAEDYIKRALGSFGVEVP